MAMAPDTRSAAAEAGRTAKKPLTGGERVKHVALRWDTAVVILLIAVFFVGLGTTPGFGGSGNLAFAFDDISEVALIALPMTLLVVTAEIDLSVGSMLGFSSALAGSLWNAGWAFETIVPLVLVVGALGGLLNGWLVTRVGLPSLAVTIGTLALYRGLASVVLGSDAITDFPQQYSHWVVDTNPIPGTFIAYPVALFIVLAIVTAVILHSTSFGRSLFALGAQEEAAFFAGIRVKRYKLILFVVTGLFAAFAGILFTLRYGSARADNGNGYELLVISAILLGGIDFDGGRGSLIGAVGGILLVGVLKNLLTLNDVPNEVQTVVTGLLLVASVITPRIIGVVTERRQRLAATAAPAASV